MNATRASRLISTIQILVSSILTLMIVIGIFLTYKAGRQYVPGMLMEIYPEMTIILGTLIPVLILRIKHRSQVAEGYLLPLFLLLLSLQTTRMLPSILDYSGMDIISYSKVAVMERFFFMASYAVLLFASIQNMKNVSTARTGVNIVFSLIAVFVVAYIIPTSSVDGLNNVHDIVFDMLVLLILLSGVATYLVSFISDRESYHMKRFFTFLFISLGDYLIMIGNGSFSLSLSGTILFVIGAVMLSIVSPKGY